MRLQTFQLTADAFALVVDKVRNDQPFDVKVAEKLKDFGRECGAAATLVTTEDVEVP